MAKGKRGARWMAEGTALLLLVFCLVVLLTNILPTRRNLAEIRRDARRLKREIAQQEIERDRLEKFAKALETDPYIQKRVYQRTFRIYGEGETVLRFADEDPQAD